MKEVSYNLIIDAADEGKVFDWKEPRFRTGENGEQVQEHLYARQLSLGVSDSIDNYVEIDASAKERAV